MKKMLVTGLAAVVAASCLFVGCQKKDGGTAAANKGGEAAPAAEGKVLNIYVWNEEFQTRVKKYYPGYNEANDTIGDVKVNWVITPNLGNAYQDKLDEAIEYFNLAIDNNDDYEYAYDGRNQAMLENHIKIADLQDYLRKNI